MHLSIYIYINITNCYRGGRAGAGAGGGGGGGRSSSSSNISNKKTTKKD
jgi:hypothetical protein